MRIPLKKPKNKMNEVILDVDIGLDDYIAIMFFLLAETLGTVKISAIVCSKGNTDLDHSCINIVRMLETVNRTDIPVYRGAKTPLIPAKDELPSIYGADGFGDLKYDLPPNMSIIQPIPAAQALYEIVSEKPNEISLICLGPVTNIALTLRLYEDFADKVKSIVVMGGNRKAIGNTTPWAEFNFYIDPEAAHIVLNGFKDKEMLIVPWETCNVAQIPMSWFQDILAKSDKPVSQLLNRAQATVFTHNEEYWTSCDAFAACAYLYPGECITKANKYYATIELGGTLTRALMLVDHLNETAPNANIVDEVNVDYLMKMFEKAA